MQPLKNTKLRPFVQVVKQPLLLKISFRAFNYFASVKHLSYLCSGVEMMASIGSEGDVRKHCSVKNYNNLHEDYLQRFFLTGKTSSFVSPMFLNAVQVMTKCFFFSLKQCLFFICFRSSFPTSLVSVPLPDNTFQLIIHTVVTYFNFFELYLQTVHS